MIKLIGILIVILGFAFKLDVLAVVLFAGIATGLVAGISINEILTIIGTSFVSNRLMSIFLISFPAIAIIEQYGLRERAATLISNLKSATAGKILGLYAIIRIIASALSIRLGGHVQFVRPLILPMAQAAGQNSIDKELPDEMNEKIKGLAAAMENYGNFFGQNIFVGASGALLIQGTLVGAGFKDVTLQSIAYYSIPIGIAASVLAVIQVLLFDKKLKKEAK